MPFDRIQAFPMALSRSISDGLLCALLEQGVAFFSGGLPRSTRGAVCSRSPGDCRSHLWGQGTLDGRFPAFAVRLADRVIQYGFAVRTFMGDTLP